MEAATQTYATVTLQNYFRMYHKLAGMTGTAETEAQELWDIYKLDVMVIPTNRPVVRKDNEDMVFKTKREKYNAVIEEIDALRNAGRPVLVGTTSGGERIGEPYAHVAQHPAQRTEREAAPARGGNRGTGWSFVVHHHCHQHGRAWYRYQAGAWREGGRWSSRSSVRRSMRAAVWTASCAVGPVGKATRAVRSLT